MNLQIFNKSADSDDTDDSSANFVILLIMVIMAILSILMKFIILVNPTILMIMLVFVVLVSLVNVVIMVNLLVLVTDDSVDFGESAKGSLRSFFGKYVANFSAKWTKPHQIFQIGNDPPPRQIW